MNTKIVTGNFDCNDNKISTLEGIPKVNGYSDFSKNLIYNYDYIDDYIDLTKINMRNNPIDELKLKLFSTQKAPLYFELFKEYDPIHPDNDNKPVIYQNRLNDFYDNIGKDRLDLTKDYILKYYTIY